MVEGVQWCLALPFAHCVQNSLAYGTSMHVQAKGGMHGAVHVACTQARCIMCSFCGSNSKRLILALGWSMQLYISPCKPVQLAPCEH